VYALLLQWEEDDLGVESEILLLREVLRHDFNFVVEQWKIPSVNAKSELTQRITDFEAGKGIKDLLIIYYGGHAVNDSRTCVWTAWFGPNSPELTWNAISPMILDCESDVLLILDCCFATTAARGSVTARGTKYILTACGNWDEATGVQRNSFTGSLIRELVYLSSRFRESGERCSSQDVHSGLLIHDRELVYSPNHVRLTEYNCDPIDLTPLSRPSMPQRIYPTPTGTHSSRTQSSKQPFSASQTREDVSIAIPDVEGACLSSIYLSQSSMFQQRMAVDIVLVPGRRGYPFTSFTSSSGAYMWPRDLLCKGLEGEKFACRLLTFGFPWKRPVGDSHAIAKFRTCSMGLVRAMRYARKQDHHRPIIFIGYGRGCTVVRDVIAHLYGEASYVKGSLIPFPLMKI
jgi:hypothetical protein